MRATTNLQDLRRPISREGGSYGEVKVQRVVRIAASLALALPLGAGLAGCSLFHSGVEPVIEFEGDERVVVMPFSESEGRLSWWESADGNAIADGVASDLEANAEDITVIPPAEVRALFDREPEQGQRGADEMSPLQIAREVRADLIIVGVVRSLRTRDELTYGMNHGTAVIDLQVLDARQEGRTVWQGRVEAEFPDDYVSVGAGGSYEMSEEQIRQGLLLTCARRVARKFYEHDEEES